jgi:hypothetical protein
MSLQQTFTKKKTVFIEIAILVIFLGGSYYLYTLFSEPTSVSTKVETSQKLFGQNLTLFLKAVNQDKISLNNTGFMDGEIVKQLQDFSESIPSTDNRGRLNPFSPYAAIRSIR